MIPPEMDVALQTNCWERDWRRMLKTDRLATLAARHEFAFARKTLFINRLDSYAEPSRLAQRAIDRGWLTEFIIVEEHSETALDFFQLSREILGRGYNYSIAELVGLYLCRAEFVLYYMGDCIPEKASPWLPKALALFARDPRIKVANLTWDGMYDEARSESASETEDFFIGPGFSDQCYLVRTADFRQPIYLHTHAASERFPLYAGDSFEKRADSWMHCHGHLRATYKHASYLHQNVPHPLPGRIKRAAGRILRSLRSKVSAGGQS